MTEFLTKPCAKCPFRKEFQGEMDYLRPGRRANIMRTLIEGAEFPCHNTVDHSTEDEWDDTEDEWDDERLPGRDEKPCVGADLVLLRANEAPQMLRVRMSLGMTNPDKLEAENEGVELWTYSECVHGTDDAPLETCSVVGQDCEAPAGYAIGGTVSYGDEFVTTDCSCCGEPICESCLEDEYHDCWAQREEYGEPPELVERVASYQGVS